MQPTDEKLIHWHQRITFRLVIDQRVQSWKGKDCLLQMLSFLLEFARQTEGFVAYAFSRIERS